MLAFLLESQTILPKRHKKFTKELASDDAEDVDDAKEEIAHTYETAQRATKAKKVVKTLTPEELEARRAEQRQSYLESLSGLKKSQKENLPYGILYKDISSKASALGLKVILDELEKISTKKSVSEVVRADGSKGPNHIYYRHEKSAYKVNEDGTPMTIKWTTKTGQKDAVILATSNEKTKGWTFGEVADKDEFMSIESVAKDTNDDGLQQVYVKPMMFTQTPEHKGDGFCQCETRNKKFNNFLCQKVEDNWVSATDHFATLPTFCCNSKVSANGKCKRHNNPSLKEPTVQWTTCGADWTPIQV